MKETHKLPEGHLQAVTDTATDAIIAADEKGFIIMWNKAAERIFQYTAEEVTGKSLTMIIPDQYKDAHEKGMDRVAKGGEKRVIGHVVELSAVKKNGEEFPIELSLSMWDADGKKYFSGIIRDISERKVAEQNLKAAETRFRSVMETATDAIITANAKGIILTWNQAATTMLGYTSEEAIQQPLTLIIPEKFKHLHEQGIERVSGGGDRHVIGKTVELAAQHKSGKQIPIELSLSTWRIGEDRFYSGIIRDISDRKLAEELREASEQKFISITETANDAIIAINQKGCIQLWNKAAEKIFGYSEQEVMGQSVTLIIPERYKALHEQGIERVNRGGERHVIGHTAELEGVHKDGHAIPLELSLSTWTFSGQHFYGGIIRDISERKKAEDQIKDQKKKLADRAKKLTKLNKEVKLKNEQLQALSNKLAKYLSRQVYTSIFEGKKEVKIESYRKKLTIFFSDIHGFTELTDRVESEVLTSVLNKYLNEMSKIAIDHGGTIDKYIGDAIMIFFGDPETLGEKQDAIACVKMAMDMKAKLIELRKEWEILGISTPLMVRMGINTGFCTVGNFGSEERLDYTIVGGPVNLASRLEGAAPVDEILISQDTYMLVKDEIDCEKMEEIRVKGIAYPVQTYKVVDLHESHRLKEEALIAQLKGFNLNIDFNALNYSDKLYARQLLEKAIAKL